MQLAGTDSFDSLLKIQRQTQELKKNLLSENLPCEHESVFTIKVWVPIERDVSIVDTTRRNRISYLIKIKQVKCSISFSLIFYLSSHEWTVLDISQSTESNTYPFSYHHSHHDRHNVGNAACQFKHDDNQRDSHARYAR